MEEVTVLVDGKNIRCALKRDALGRRLRHYARFVTSLRRCPRGEGRGDSPTNHRQRIMDQPSLISGAYGAWTRVRFPPPPPSQRIRTSVQIILARTRRQQRQGIERGAREVVLCQKLAHGHAALR